MDDQLDTLGHEPRVAIDQPKRSLRLERYALCPKLQMQCPFVRPLEETGTKCLVDCYCAANDRSDERFRLSINRRSELSHDVSVRRLLSSFVHLVFDGFGCSS